MDYKRPNPSPPPHRILRTIITQTTRLVRYRTMAKDEDPQTPNQGTLRPGHDDDCFPESDSLRSSLGSPASSIFSANESVSSEDTEPDCCANLDNEGDSPKEPSTPDIPSIKGEDTEAVDGWLKEELDASTDASTRKSTGITCLGPKSNCLPRPTTTVIKEEDGRMAKLNLLETYNQTFRDRSEPPTSNDPQTTRRRSFSLVVDFRFADHKLYGMARTASRIIKSDIGVKPDYSREAAQVNTPSPSGRLVPPQAFQPHKAALSNVPIQKGLQECLTRPLAPKDSTQTGFIYVFWYPGGFGHVKIGYTKDVEKRMKEWSKQCGRKLEKYFPSEQADMEPVPHRLRVEQLVHAELARYRKEEPRCGECGKRHIEWFEVDVNFAISVVQKWVKWMRERPYERVELEDGGVKWVLGKRHMDNIALLSTPSPTPTSTPMPIHTPKPKPKRSSVRRKSVR
ncbi:hypothetical protein ASPVEDRAFT_35185 [Aspergillus versicolor CBS 583.65]|uniref:Bacteriophage T5 Orf172 DNA-binding domain-containing protein n=1 Tax=Aspergillus versicolor CBS 583.65 TaxID=1036611 RepID=A0A1L9P2W6_ASPVE|nr:uncharacterized protein ASPVEDRAFT_35185 [Aspergillus versicolor CBS 583.65]OJI95879.1 hypothetical protein ASPVEDRAFT_35185 [Aspergillus versicolor CBS 583.65]